MIRLILLDLDGVVRHFDPVATRNIEAQYALEPGVIARRAFAAPLLERVTTGRISHANWVDAIGSAIGNVGAAREWAAQGTRIDRVVIDLVHSTAVPTAILTNGTDATRRELAKHGLTNGFPRIYNSAEIGITKPDPRVFRHVLDEERLDPGAVFFVDDSSANVEAARSLDIHGHVFTDAPTLADALRDLALGRNRNDERITRSDRLETFDAHGSA